MRRRPHARRRDRGITVIFFALALTGILAVAALVLGGSVGYEAARNGQTAADAAALAGTSALQNHKQDWIVTPADAVLEEVATAVEDNGATLEDCDLVDAEYAITGAESDVIAPCDRLPFLPDSAFQRTAGVRVTVSDTRDVPFAAFVSRDQITSRSTAAATIQPVARGKSPFMVCTDPAAVGHPAPALIPDATAPHGYAVNSAAVGKLYVLWGNQMKNLGRDCGNPDSAWRGLVELPADGYPLPSTEATTGRPDANWWAGDEGNKVGLLTNGVAGANACTFAANSDPDDIELGCFIAVPLCPRGNADASDFRLFCVRMGLFQITHIGEATIDTVDPPEETPCGSVKNNIICGRFIGATAAARGRGVAEQPDRYAVAVIKLVQ